MKEICTALSNAQAQIKPALLDCVNPYFNSKYASLASVMEAIRKPLATNGLSFIQLVVDGRMNTTLYHLSGESLTSSIPMIISKQDSQGVGAAVTYARRFGICCMLGVVAEDDLDGNDTLTKEQELKAKQSKPQAPSKPNANPMADLDKETTPKATTGGFNFSGPSTIVTVKKGAINGK